MYRKVLLKLVSLALATILMVGGTMGCDVKNTEEPCVINMPDELDSETDLMIRQYAIEYWQKNPNTTEEGRIWSDGIPIDYITITEYYKATSGAVIIGFGFRSNSFSGITVGRWISIDNELRMPYACWVYVWHNGFIYTNIRNNAIRSAYDDGVLLTYRTNIAL